MATPSHNALGNGYTPVHAATVFPAEPRNSGEYGGSTCVPAQPRMTPPEPVQARGQVGSKVVGVRAKGGRFGEREEKNCKEEWGLLAARWHPHAAMTRMLTRSSSSSRRVGRGGVA